MPDERAGPAQPGAPGSERTGQDVGGPGCGGHHHRHQRGDLEPADHLAPGPPGRHGGEDLALLDAELAKLAAYADGTPVGAEAVRLLGVGHEESVFTLLDALLEGRSSTALATLRGLYDRGRRPEELLPQVVAFVRRLLLAREAATRRLPLDEVAREHEVNAYAINRVIPQARLVGTRQLDAALQRLLEADRAMKTSAREPEAELELAVGRVAALLRRRG